MLKTGYWGFRDSQTIEVCVPGTGARGLIAEHAGELGQTKPFGPPP
jgi:hypothetical protein